MTKSDVNVFSLEAFPIRTYGKGELALCYFHRVQQQTAVKEFNGWIRKFPGLEEELINTGMNRTARMYTPRQVRIIVDALGEP